MLVSCSPASSTLQHHFSQTEVMISMWDPVVFAVMQLSKAMGQVKVTLFHNEFTCHFRLESSVPRSSWSSWQSLPQCWNSVALPCAKLVPTQGAPACSRWAAVSSAESSGRRKASSRQSAVPPTVETGPWLAVVLSAVPLGIILLKPSLKTGSRTSFWLRLRTGAMWVAGVPVTVHAGTEPCGLSHQVLYRAPFGRNASASVLHLISD